MSKNILLIILAISTGIILIISSQFYVTYQNLKLAEQTITEQGQAIESQQQTIQSHEGTIQSQTQTIQNQQNTIKSLQTQVSNLQDEVSTLQNQVTILEGQVNTLQNQLGETTAELEETTRLLNVAQEYEERVEQGVYLSKAYKLLGDYDKTVGIVASFTNTFTPTTDRELWERAEDIYNWLGNNYDYCSDKGFCVGDSCTQIQFFSPDELLYYGSQHVLCGDCDDQAQLFAGMMYATGVPYDKVRVECGSVPAGGHCWSGIYVGGNWYKIDPVCSNPAEYWDFFGYKFLISGKEFPTNYQDVDCFSSYTLTSWYTPEGYHTV